MAKQYNFKNVRALLAEGFTDEELRILCFDVPTFRPVYSQLTKVTSKAEIVQLLLEYVEQKELVETLLDHAKERNSAKYKKYYPYEITLTPAISKDVRRIGDSTPKQRIQVYLQGEISLLSVERRSAVIESLAALIGVSPQSIEVYSIYEGSIVFDLGVPPDAVQRLRFLLQLNDAQLRLLKVEKVLLEKESGEIEEWIIKEGKFDLITSTHLTISSDVHGKSQQAIERLIIQHNRRLQILKEQMAQKGLSVDPRTLIEIEDIEDQLSKLQQELKEVKQGDAEQDDIEQYHIKKLKELIADDQRRLQKLKEQRARFGLDTPPHVLTEIEDVEANLERLQEELRASRWSPGSESASDYNLAAIRQLLLETFSDEDLTTFCYDYFRQVYESFSVGISPRMKVHRLIDYCEQHDSLDKLLSLIKEYSPRQYEKYVSSESPIELPIKNVRAVDSTISESDSPVRNADRIYRPPLPPPPPSPIKRPNYIIYIFWILVILLCPLLFLAIIKTDIGNFIPSSEATTRVIFSPITLYIVGAIVIIGMVLVLRQPIIATLKTVRERIRATLEIIWRRVESLKQAAEAKEQNKILQWELYLDGELSKHHHIYVNKLKPIPRAKRQPVIESYVESNPHIVYDSNQKCLMHRSWPKLKILLSAWTDLHQHLHSDLDTFGNKLAEFVHTLEEPFGVRLVATKPVARFEPIVGCKIDMSNAFADLNFQRKEILICAVRHQQPTLEQLSDLYEFVKDRQGASIAFLLLFSDDDHARQIQVGLNQQFRHQSCDIIVMTLTNLIGWLKSDRPREAFRKTVVLNTSLKAVSPFVIEGPTPENMFFGRESELRQIRDHLLYKSFAIIGGRRVGKTSIAYRLHKGFLPAAEFYTIYQDISNISSYDTFLATSIADWQPISNPDMPQTFGDLFAQLPLDRKVVLLLDEADKLIPIDRTSGWLIFNKLREAVNNGHLRVIFLGENTLRKVKNDADSPFYNFAEDILIGRLDFDNVKELIIQPLKKLEIVYEDAIVTRIHRFTSGHPNVVQRLCYRLIQVLDKRNDRKLTLDDVEEVINDPTFQKIDFFGTYFSRATLLERLIVIMMAQADLKPCNAIDIRQLLSPQLEHQPGLGEVDDALERLTKLRSILDQSPQGYTFAVDAIPTLLKQSQSTLAKVWFADWVEKFNCYGDVSLEQAEKLEEEAKKTLYKG